MKSITKRIIATLGICAALVLEAGATAFRFGTKAISEAKAVDYTELFSVSSDDVVTNTNYAKYETTVSSRDYIITFGGNDKSIGTNSGNRSKCNLSSYSKYAVSPVTSSDVASAFVLKTSVADVSKISYTFNGGSNQTSTSVYLIYSSDNNTFSQIKLTSGTQGATISSGTAYTFAKSTGYFGLLFKATNSSGAWRIDSINITFYKEKSSKTISSIAVNTPPTKVAYYEGNNFDPTGLVITATYDDASTEDIPYASHESDFSFEPSTTTALKTSDSNVVITYGKKTANQAITVNEDTLNSITLSGSVTGTVSGGWDLSGVIVTGNYASGSKTITDATPTTSTPNPTEYKDYTVNVSVTYKSITQDKDYNVTVVKTGLTPAEAFTPEEAIAKGTSGSTSVYVRGEVTKVDSCSASYGNATFWFGDFELYRVKLDSSLGKMTDDTVKVGQTILVYGKITTYGSTVEIGTDGLIKEIVVKEVSAINVTVNPTNPQYSGVAFDSTGMTVMASYNTGSPANVTSLCTFEPAVLAADTTSVTIKYTEDSKTVQTSLTVDVLTFSKITVEGATTSFRAGDTFSFGGTAYKWYTHSNGSAESKGEAIATSDLTISKSGQTLTKGDHQEVTVSYNGMSTSYYIDVDFAYVTGITMDSTKEVGLGGSVTFAAVVSPNNANQEVNYSIDTAGTTLGAGEYSLVDGTLTIASSIANSGVVVVVATSVGLNSSGNPVTASCTVSVTKVVIAQITAVQVTGSVTQAVQYVGKDFNYAGLSFAPVWSEGTHGEVTITGADINWPALTNGMTSITGKYDAGTGILDVYVDGFSVVNDYLDSISISGDFTKKSYYSNETLWDYHGLSVSGLNASGDPATIDQASVVYSADKTPAQYLATSASSLTVTATYGGKSNNIVITSIVVTEYKLVNIEVTTNPTKLSYILGEDFNSAGIVVKATYSDSTVDTDFTGYTLDTSAINKFAAGSYSVKVKAPGVSDASFNVTYSALVPQEGYDDWRLVTDASKLSEGDQILLCASNTVSSTTHYYTNGTFGSNKYFSSLESSIDSKTKYLIPHVDSLVITLGGSSGSWTLMTSEGKVGMTANKAMGLNLEDTAAHNYYTISIDSNGIATIADKNTSSSYGKILYNTGSPRFLNYTSDPSSTMLLPSIYKHFKQTAIEASLIKLDATCSKSFTEGDTLYISDLTVEGLYNDDDATTKAITSGVTFDDDSTSKVLAGGDNNFTIKCGSITASITVYAAPIVPVSSVTIGNKVENLYYYDAANKSSNTFTATVLPAEATYKTVTWSVDDTSLATIDSNGKLTPTGTASGDVVVTATAGSAVDTCTVHIVKDTVSSIAVTTNPKTSYIEGESVSLSGLVIDATMGSGAHYSFAKDSGAAITADKSTVAYGDTSITVSFEGKSTSYDITVAHRSPVSISTVTATQTTYAWGASVDVTKFAGSVTFDNGEVKDLADLDPANITIVGFDSTHAGTNNVTLKYTENGVSVTSNSIALTIGEPKLTSISANTEVVHIPYAATEGDLRNALTVNAIYEDSSSSPITGYSITGFTAQQKGAQTITLSYTEGGITKTTTVDIYVDNPLLVSIAVEDGSGNPVSSVNVNYGASYRGDVVVKAYYEDGSSVVIDSYTDDYVATNVGANVVTISYTEGSITKTASLTVNVAPAAVTSVEVVGYTGTAIEVPYNSNLEDSITVLAHYESEAPGDPGTIVTGYTVTGYNKTDLSGVQSVTISFGGKSTTIDVKVLQSTVVASIEASTTKTEVEYGGTFTKDDVSVTATYTDGHTGSIACDSISGFDPSKVGAQTVTVSAGGKETTITVTVLPSTVISSIEASTTKTEVAYGGTFTKDDVSVTATYTDGHTGSIVCDSISGFDGNKVGAQTITVSAGGKTTTITVTVLPSTVVASIEASTTKTEVVYGGSFTKDDVNVVATYTDGHTGSIACDSISGFDPTVVGAQTITVSAGGKETTITVTVLQSTVVASIEASTAKTKVVYGGSFTKDDVSVVATYTDGHTASIACDSISGFDGNKVGTQTITVSAGGKETTISVTVLPSTVISSISASTDKTEVAYGGSFTKDDVSVVATYTDGHTASIACDSISGFDSSKVGAQTITVSAGGKETTISVTVLPSTVISSISASTDKSEVAYGGSFTKDDVSVVATYTDGHTASIACDSISGFDSSKVGEQVITVSAGGKETTINVTVLASTVVDHIDASTEKTEIEYGGSLSIADITVVATYTDGHTEVVPCESFSGFDPMVVGVQQVTVNAVGKSTVITVTVKQSEVIDHIVASTDKEVVDYGSTFTKDDVSVTYVYTDGHEVTGQKAESISGFDSHTIGEQEITVVAAGKTTTIKVTVNGHVAVSVTVTDYKDTVDQGNEYVFEGTVTVTYADGTSEVVKEGYTVGKVDTSSHGEKTIKVSYGKASTTIKVHVVQTKTPLEPTSITAIAGGAVVGVAALAIGMYFLLKKFKL